MQMVLVILIHLTNPYPNESITMQKFDTEDACATAGILIRDSINLNRHAKIAEYYCTPYSVGDR